MNVQGATVGGSVAARFSGLSDELGRRLEALRPPKRSFLAKLFGIRKTSANAASAASLMHAHMRPKDGTSAARTDAARQAWSGALSPKDVIRNFASKNLDATLIGLSALKMFAALEGQLSGNVADRRSLSDALQHLSEQEVLQLFKDAIQGIAGPHIPDQKAQARAREAYVAVVAQIQRFNATELPKDYEKQLRSTADSAAIEQMGQRIEVDRRLGDADRKQLQQLCTDRRDALAMKPESIRGLVARLTPADFGTPKADLQANRRQCEELRSRVQDSPLIPDAERPFILRELSDTIALLQAVETRSDDLAALRGGGRQQLAGVLERLPNPKAYAAHKQALDHVRTLASANGEAAALDTLNQKIQHGTQARWLLDIRKGDADIVDMVFDGALWHEDAYALKAAGVDPKDERAMKNLDVQHNLRIVALDLDTALQLRKLAGPADRNETRGFLDLLGFMRRKDEADKLPTGVFRATQPSATLIAWFMKNAPGTTLDLNLVIANWIRLSCHDPGTGTTDEKRVRELLKNLELKGVDVDAIGPFIQQGFASTSEVVACRRQVQAFAKALSSDTLVRQMEEARSLRWQAENIAALLLRSATGREFQRGAPQAEIDSAMSGKLREVAPSTTMNMVEVLGKEILRRDQLRSEARTVPWQLNSGRAGDRSWIDSPDKRRAARPLHDQVTQYLHLRAQWQNATKVANADPKSQEKAKERDAAFTAMMAAREAIRQFDPVDLRARPGQTAPAPDNELIAVKPQLDALIALEQVDANVVRLQGLASMKPGASVFLRQALQIAILQTAAASTDPEFTAQKAMAGVLKRLKAYGFDLKDANSAMRELIAGMARQLAGNTKNLEELCKQMATEAAAAGAVGVATQVASGKTSLESVILTDAQKKREETAEIISNQFKDLAPNTEIAVTFGQFGEVSVSVPIAIVASANATTRVERNNSIRIAQGDGESFTVTLQTGGSVREGISVAAVADLLTAGGYVSRDSAAGFSFTIQGKEACRQLTIALAHGDAVDASWWKGTQIQRTAGAGRQAGAEIEAGLDLGALALKAHAHAAKGVKVESARSTERQIETHTVTGQALASLSAELAADQGSAQAEIGVDRSVRKSLHKRWGMFEAGSHVVVAQRVVGQNVKSCLQHVLPKELQSTIDTVQEQLGEVPDGSEIFVRAELHPDAIAEARRSFDAAQRHLRDASLASGDRRAAALEEAEALVAQAYALTRDPRNYAPSHIGWTSRELVEVTQDRRAYQNFANGETQATKLIAIEASKGSLTLGALP